MIYDLITGFSEVYPRCPIPEAIRFQGRWKGGWEEKDVQEMVVVREAEWGRGSDRLVDSSNHILVNWFQHV